MPKGWIVEAENQAKRRRESMNQYVSPVLDSTRKDKSGCRRDLDSVCRNLDEVLVSTSTQVP